MDEIKTISKTVNVATIKNSEKDSPISVLSEIDSKKSIKAPSLSVGELKSLSEGGALHVDTNVEFFYDVKFHAGVSLEGDFDTVKTDSIFSLEGDFDTVKTDFISSKTSGAKVNFDSPVIFNEDVIFDGDIEFNSENLEINTLNVTEYLDAKKINIETDLIVRTGNATIASGNLTVSDGEIIGDKVSLNIIQANQTDDIIIASPTIVQDNATIASGNLTVSDGEIIGDKVSLNIIQANQTDDITIASPTIVQGNATINNENDELASLSIKSPSGKKLIHHFFDEDNNHYDGYLEKGGIYDIYKNIKIDDVPPEGLYVAKLEIIDERPALVFDIREEFFAPSNVFVSLDGEEIDADNILVFDNSSDNFKTYTLLMSSGYISLGNRVSGLIYDAVAKKRVSNLYATSKASSVILDLSVSDVFFIELASDVDISFENIPEVGSDVSIFVKIFIRTDGSANPYAVSWDDDILWENGSAIRVNSVLKNVSYFVAGKASNGSVRLWNNGDVTPNIVTSLVFSGELIKKHVITHSAGLNNFVNCSSSIFIEGNSISGVMYELVKKKRVSSAVVEIDSETISINPANTSSICVKLDSNKSFVSNLLDLQEGFVYFVSLILIGDEEERQIEFEENVLFAEDENLDIATGKDEKTYISLKYRKIDPNNIQVLFSKFCG